MIIIYITLGIIALVIGLSFILKPKESKESFRKFLVNIKRNTHIIPLFLMSLACIMYSLRMTAYSNTIALINQPGMGVCFFVNTLISFLAIITFVLAFPRRQKPKLFNIILTIVMLFIIIACEGLFYYYIIYGTEIKENPIEITKAREYVNTAKTMIIVHISMIVVSLVSIFTLPLYKKALQKVNTSIKVDDVEMNEIDISEE